MTRVYQIKPGEDLGRIVSLDRKMSDGSSLEDEGEIEVRCCERETLEQVRIWILNQPKEYRALNNRGLENTDDRRLMKYPQKPLMGRADNKTAYAVLDRELRVLSVGDVHLQRPGIIVGREEQLSSNGYGRNEGDRQHWEPLSRMK